MGVDEIGVDEVGSGRSGMIPQKTVAKRAKLL